MSTFKFRTPPSSSKEQLTRLRLRYVAERLDAMLNDAAREAPTYLDSSNAVLAHA